MQAKYFFISALAASLHACGTPDVIVDSSDDNHCSLLSFYFSGLAKYADAPDEQQLATKTIFEWYASKERQQAEREGVETVKRRVLSLEPVFDAIKKNPNSMTDELEACSARAQKSIGFTEFARTISL